MNAACREWVAVGFGLTFGAFVGWLVLPWVYSWRQQKREETL